MAEWHDECGVFGVFGCKDAAKLCNLGLYALQHRGQESCGIVSLDGTRFYVVKKMGLVSEVFNKDNLAYLKGYAAVGHVRYSTTGSPNPNNIQPLYTNTSKGKLAIAHNGNLTNAFSIYKRLCAQGALFQSTADSEVILHLFSQAKGKQVVKSMLSTLSQVEGAYCLSMLGEGYMMAARDPHGFRPLVLGRLKDGWIVSSETCALDLIGATYEREIEPGELIYIDENGLTSHRIPVERKNAYCVFEHVYFSRPDSILFGDLVHSARRDFGRVLAREHPVDSDIVIAIPDSGNSAALGYSEESGIPFEMGITRNHYVGRTFIQPTQRIRDFAVRVKLNPIRAVLEGKRVVVVDDSIVRGTTSQKRVAAIRKAGAKEIHLRISSPPITHPCHFGIDTPNRDKLIAAQLESTEEIRKHVGADSLGYLSREGMLSVIQSNSPSDFCTACFTGKFPIRVKNKGKYAMETTKIKLYDQK